MKPKTHNKTKKMRGGRKQTGGFLDGVFWNNKQPSESNQPVSDQPASSKTWWKFWESSATNNTSTSETDKQDTAVQGDANPPASSKPWWKFWESSATNNTSTNETVNPVVQEESPTKTEEELLDSNIDSDLMNGGRRRKIRQRRTKKKSKTKTKSKSKSKSKSKKTT